MVDGLRRGERAAFDAAFTRFRARVYGFALRLSGRRDVAEDLFQETWLKLARAAPSLREDTDLTAWLFTVVRNEYVSWRRWSMFDLSRLVLVGEESAHLAHTEPHDAPDERLQATRSVAELERALAALSPADREVLLLVGVEGVEQEQAAVILGIRYDALRQRLARARVALARALEKSHRKSER
jgi:RNA polymerase sigma-70 factor (ECF subfamily)